MIHLGRREFRYFETRASVCVANPAVSFEVQLSESGKYGKSGSLVSRERECACRRGNGWRGRPARLLPGMLKLPKARQGRSFPASRIIERESRSMSGSGSNRRHQLLLKLRQNPVI